LSSPQSPPQSKNNETVSAAGGHKLTGSVKKRNVAFSTAMRKKLGWKRKEVSDLEESLA